jgi:hypothetical protein
MIQRHQLNGFFINIIGPGLDENRALLADVAEIVRESVR